MADLLSLISLEAAQKIIKAQLSTPLPEIQMLLTEESVGRVCAETIFVKEPYPPFTRSAMDGYAVLAESTANAEENRPVSLHLSGEVLMGTNAGVLEKPSDAFLIHTGGMVPENADAVVILENTERLSEDTILIKRAVQAGENVIFQGEDVKVGDVLLERGKRITAHDVAALTSAGVTSLAVYEKVGVAIISIGDELIAPHEMPSAGQIRDTNSISLRMLCQRYAAEIRVQKRIKDDPAALQAALASTKQTCRLVLVAAGSSVSARDLTARVVEQFGSPGILIHGIKIRPGKPTLFAKCENQFVFGLPGNPVSAFVTGWLLAMPVLRHLSGEINPQPPIAVEAILNADVASVIGREDFIPVKLNRNRMPYTAIPVHFKSNLIFSLAHADGLLYIPDTAADLSAGERVKVYIHTQSY